MEQTPAKRNNQLQTSSRQPLKYLQEIRPKGVADLLNSKIGTLAKLENDQGETMVKALVIYLITDLIDYFNVKECMSVNAVAQTANFLIFDYKKVFTPDHFKLCFDNIKRGKYGKIYNRIDGDMIQEFVRKFDIEIEDELIMLRIEENKMRKLAPFTLDDTLLKVLKDVAEKVSVDKPAPERPMNEGTKLAKGVFGEYEKEFDRLNKEQRYPKFITYKEKKLSFEEYCNLRYEEEHEL